MIPPGVLRLSQSMEEHGQLRRGLGVGAFQPVTSDPDVAAVGMQSHPDRQGAVGVAQPVADLCVESGDRQVRSLPHCGGQCRDLRGHSTDEPAVMRRWFSSMQATARATVRPVDRQMTCAFSGVAGGTPLIGTRCSRGLDRQGEPKLRILPIAARALQERSAAGRWSFASEQIGLFRTGVPSTPGRCQGRHRATRTCRKPLSCTQSLRRTWL